MITIQGAGQVTDTYLSNVDATSNFNTNGIIATGRSAGATPNTLRSLIKFDLSGLDPLQKITKATLVLVYAADNSTNAANLKVYRVKRAWNVAQATWNVYTSGNNWGTAGVANTTSDREAAEIGSAAIPAAPTVDTQVEIELDPTKIQEMLSGGAFTNNGFLLQTDVENSDNINYYATDTGNAANMPKLLIQTGGGGFFLAAQ